MTTLHDRTPLRAMRNSVLGFLGGATAGTVFVAGVLLLDIGHIASMAANAGGSLSLGDLALLPITFGLIGLITAPVVATASRDRSA